MELSVEDSLELDLEAVFGQLEDVWKGQVYEEDVNGTVDSNEDNDLSDGDHVELSENLKNILTEFDILRIDCEKENEVDSNTLFVKRSADFQNMEKQYLKINSLVEMTKQALGSLNEVEEKQKFILTQTDAVYKNSQSLLKRQESLEQQIKDMEGPLKVFMELDRIAARFGVILPKSSLQIPQKSSSKVAETVIRLINVDGPEMIEEMNNIQRCIEELRLQHMIYKTGNLRIKDETYQEHHLHFLQLFIRGFALWKNYIVESLEKTKYSVQSVISQGTHLSSERKDILFYQRYSDLAAKLKPIIAQFENDKSYEKVIRVRVRKYLKECKEVYHQTRTSLLQLQALRSVNFLEPDSLVLLLRKFGGNESCEIYSVVLKEHELFKRFFEIEPLEELLEGEEVNNVDPETASVKSVVSGKSDARTILSQMSISFKSLKSLRSFQSLRSRKSMHNKIALAHANGTSGNGASSSVVGLLLKEVRRHHIGEGDVDDPFGDVVVTLCSPFYEGIRPLIIHTDNMEILCDAVRVIEGEIMENIVEPNLEHLYPLASVFEVVLKDIQERLIFISAQYFNGEILNFKNDSTTEVKGEWYGALEKTLLALARLYKCVEPVTFNDLMNEAVYACTANLLKFSKDFGKGRPALSAVLGDLFLVKHLLVLREQIAPFDLHLTSRTHDLSIDFRMTLASLGDFLRNGRQIFRTKSSPDLAKPTNRLSLLEIVARGVHVKESNVDCKQNLDILLREVCDKFILNSYEFCVLDIVNFASKIQAKNASLTILEAEEFTKIELPKLPENLRILAKELIKFVPNEESHKILFQPIKANVFAKASEVQDTISSLLNKPGVDIKSVKQILERTSNIRAQVAAISTEGLVRENLTIRN